MGRWQRWHVIFLGWAILTLQFNKRGLPENPRVVRWCSNWNIPVWMVSHCHRWLSEGFLGGFTGDITSQQYSNQTWLQYPRTKWRFSRIRSLVEYYWHDVDTSWTYWSRPFGNQTCLGNPRTKWRFMKYCRHWHRISMELLDIVSMSILYIDELNGGFDGNKRKIIELNDEFCGKTFLTSRGYPFDPIQARMIYFLNLRSKKLG